MTFRDLAIKNFKGNVRKYLSVFLCYSLCVMVLQVFFNILLNEGFASVLSSKTMKMLLNFSLIVLIIFLVFFISYAMQTFLKLRSKELGIYLMVGMRRKDLITMIFIETCIIIALALIIGFVFGTILSCLLYLLFKTLLELNNITFTFEFIAYVETAVIFLGIFFINLIIIWLYSKKLHLNEIMKQAKKPETITMPKPTSSLLLSLLGFILLYFAHLSLYDYIAGTRTETNSPFTPVIFAVCCFVGIYLIISRLGALILYFLKKFKKNYYNNILSVTEISNKINQNKKVIFSATILFIVVIFLISAAYVNLVDMPRVVEVEQPFHIVYIDYEKKLNSKKIDELTRKNNLKITGHKTLDFLYGTRIDRIGESVFSEEVAVISDEQYRRITGKLLEVDKGESMQISLDLANEADEQFPYETIELDFGEKTYDFKFNGEKKIVVINSDVQPSKLMLIVDSVDFKKMKEDVESRYFGTFNMINFDNWKKTGPVVAEIKKQLGVEENNTLTGSNSKDSVVYNNFKTASRIEYYTYVKQENSMRLFIVCFMGILFLICTSCVIYFKLITDITGLRVKYKQLTKVGITKREFKKILANELKVVFFTPVLLGSCLGYILIRIATLDSRMEEIFSVNTIIVIVAFFIFQLFYYVITLRKYNTDIITRQ